jgi:regulatory protein YycI of two-component signal transduction system YycFG
MNLQKIIEEADKLGYQFTLKDTQDVLDTKPNWCIGVETEAEAVQDYIDAFGG